MGMIYILFINGTYLSYMTDCHTVPCWLVINVVTVQTGSGAKLFQFTCKYVTEAFSLYNSDIARCLPQLLDHSLTLVQE